MAPTRHIGAGTRAVSRATSTVAIAVAVGLTVALLVAGCGNDSTTETGADSGAIDQPQPSDGDGLAVRIAGLIEGDLLCPGGRRPCLPVEGSIETPPDGTVWVSGRLVDGALVVDDQQPLPERSQRDYSNRCPDRVFSGAPPMDWLEAVYEDLAGRPDGFADLWDSDDGVLHLGVAGDPGPAEAYLEQLGLTDQVCLVAGFPHPDQTLEAVQTIVSEAARNHGFDGYGVGRDAWEGTVTIDLPRFDQYFRAELDEISQANGGVPIIALAGIEVIDGSLDDYDEAVASIAVTPEAGDQLTASCGPVVFSTVPPDLDEFPPLDDDARSALDELVNGPTGVEAERFDTDYRWSIASRTDDELVLFGQGAEADDGHWRQASFEQRDGAWTPSGWGGCRVEIDAVGLGPASVAIDPDHPIDPGATELSLLINEQNCASGQAPVGREIVPLVTESADSVTVIVLVAPVEGGADCPSNPWHPITVTLDSPLGSRQLFDGHEFPAQPMVSADVAD